MNNKLKISIVTPVYNCEKYIEKCILSIKNQDYDNYEHIIVDGQSTDGTLDIVRKYDGTYPMRWISETDKGMYDAINKGFGMASGDIFAWINADDCYMPHAFDTMAKIMTQRNISWCTGFPVVLTEDDRMYEMPIVLPIYLQNIVEKGYSDGRISPMIQQESTFWTRELWEKSGGINTKYKAAGDYWLWRTFAKYEKLYTVDTVIAGFRRHEGQISSQMDKYWNEVGTYTMYKKFLSKTKIVKLYIYLCSLKEHEQLIRMRNII
jgi:glycosyltransferase involved in cell wall biosynthesis